MPTNIQRWKRKPPLNEVSLYDLSMYARIEMRCCAYFFPFVNVAEMYLCVRQKRKKLENLFLKLAFHY